jgi:hypothetical protein
MSQNVLLYVFVACSTSATYTNITHGKADVTMSRASYQCNIGFTLHGNSTLYCLLNGTWNTKPPTCRVTGSISLDFHFYKLKHIRGMSGKFIYSFNFHCITIHMLYKFCQQKYTYLANTFIKNY